MTASAYMKAYNFILLLCTPKYVYQINSKICFCINLLFNLDISE